MSILAVTEPFNWNNVFMFLIAAIAAWTHWRQEQRTKEARAEAKRREEKREEDRKQMAAVATVVAKVAEQTDGINKQLVAAEKIISRAEGKKEERAEVAERAAVADILAKPAEVIVVNAPTDPLPVEQVKKKP